MRGQSRDYRREAIFNREGPGERTQLHVLIPIVPCQTFTCSQASPDFRSVQIFKTITFCFLFVFSLFSQNSRAALSGHNCKMCDVDDCTLFMLGSVGFREST
ncbi:hypothetical protein FHD44_17045 [Escherichia coli]|nr:hypothetical protein [Escherichia coli]